MKRIKTNVEGKQHFVPKFLLDKFSLSSNKTSRNKSGSIAVYDKIRNNFRINNTKDICAHKNYYNIPITKDLLKKLNPTEKTNIDNLLDIPLRFTIEGTMSCYENGISVILDKIIKYENLICLSEEEFCQLIVFIVYLDLRNPSMRKLGEKYSEQVKKIVTDAQKEIPTLKLSDEFEFIINDECVKFSHLSSTMKIDPKFPLALNSMYWFLFKAPERHVFFVSDRPILRTNYYCHHLNGYASPDVEIYIPISDKFYIVCFHKDFIQAVPGATNIEYYIKQRLLDFIDNYPDDQKSKIIMGAKVGSKPIISFAALQMINSAQYHNSNYVFCSSKKYLEKTIKLFNVNYARDADAIA